MKDNTEKNLINIISTHLGVDKRDIIIDLYSFANDELSIDGSYRNWNDKEGSYEVIEFKSIIPMYELLMYMIKKL